VIKRFLQGDDASGDGAADVNSLALSGTAVVDSDIKVFDGTNLLGAATADASGIWTFETGLLSDGAHSFTATATDAAGNISAASSPFTYSALNPTL